MLFRVFLSFADLPVNGTAAERYGNHVGGPPEEDLASGAAAGHDYLGREG